MSENTANPTLYYEDKKITNVEDGIVKGMKRVSYEIKIPIEGQDDLKPGEEPKTEIAIETIDIPDWELDASTFIDKPGDATDGRNRRAIFVVDNLYKVLEQLDIRPHELAFYMQKLVDKIKGQEEQATVEAFGLEDKFDLRLHNFKLKGDKPNEDNASDST